VPHISSFALSCGFFVVCDCVYRPAEEGRDRQQAKKLPTMARNAPPNVLDERFSQAAEIVCKDVSIGYTYLACSIPFARKGHDNGG